MTDRKGKKAQRTEGVQVEHSVVSLMLKDRLPGDDVIVVFNFTPSIHFNLPPPAAVFFKHMEVEA